jgi:glucan phosphorylase
MVHARVLKLAQLLANRGCMVVGYHHTAPKKIKNVTNSNKPPSFSNPYMKLLLHTYTHRST